MMDNELFQKYQSDLRIEHLLLEKEVKDAITYMTSGSSYVDMENEQVQLIDTSSPDMETQASSGSIG